VPGTFVQDVARDPKAETITSAIIALARALGVRIAAEGVEIEGHRRWLADHGCDELQGFLLYQPMPPDELVARLAG